MRLVDRLKAAAIARTAVPLFPIGHFTERSTSGFKASPPPYTKLVCMVTHRTSPWMETVARCDDRGPRPEAEQDQRPAAKFKPRGAKPCESNSDARGAGAKSTPGTSRGRSGGKSSARGGRYTESPDAPTY
jgi:hypothetical protein